MIMERGSGRRGTKERKRYKMDGSGNTGQIIHTHTKKMNW